MPPVVCHFFGLRVRLGLGIRATYLANDDVRIKRFKYRIAPPRDVSVDAYPFHPLDDARVEALGNCDWPASANRSSGPGPWRKDGSWYLRKNHRRYRRPDALTPAFDSCSRPHGKYTELLCSARDRRSETKVISLEETSRSEPVWSFSGSLECNRYCLLVGAVDGKPIHRILIPCCCKRLFLWITGVGMVSQVCSQGP